MREIFQNFFSERKISTITKGRKSNYITALSAIMVPFFNSKYKMNMVKWS